MKKHAKMDTASKAQPVSAPEKDSAQKRFLDSSALSAYTVLDIAEFLHNVLAHLDNRTCTAQTVSVPAPSKGDIDMARLHRQRVCVGANGENAPIIKWVQGKSIDELNDNIVRTYLANDMLSRLLSPENRKELALRLLATLPAADVMGEQTGVVIPSAQCVTFQAYTETWIKTYKEGVLKPTTLAGYRCNLSKHIYPALGDCPLPDITTDMIQKFLMDRQHLARNTLHTMLALISEILDSAVEDGVIPRNPALSKRVFIPSEKKTKRKALTLEEVQDVIRQLYQAEDVTDRRLLALMLFTGMRRGEILGLKWEDIDFEKETMSVSRAVSYASNQPILSSTKTKNGVRVIPLTPQLKEFLRPLEADGFVIGGDKPVTKMVYIRLFRNIRKRFELHGATAHVFRHSYLSLLNQAGVDPKTIQSIGGHGSFLMTYDLYVHTNGEQIASAGKKVSGLLSPISPLSGNDSTRQL